jgi:anti-anti-sigma regulatory factor
LIGVFDQALADRAEHSLSDEALGDILVVLDLRDLEFMDWTGSMLEAVSRSARRV